MTSFGFRPRCMTSALREDGAGRFSRNQFGDQERNAVFAADVEELDDLLMIERAGGAGFGLETAAPVGAAGDLRRKSRARKTWPIPLSRAGRRFRLGRFGTDVKRVRTSAPSGGVVDGKPRSQMFAKTRDQRVENIVDAFGE